MKLIKARVTNFRAVEDSGEFDIDNLTCLVGKNEAGKTALLHALYGLNPLYYDFRYDRARDYPRRHLTRYKERHPDEADVVVSTWLLEEQDIAAIDEKFGRDVLVSPEVKITKKYGAITTWDIKYDERVFLMNAYAAYGFSPEEIADLSAYDEVGEVYRHLTGRERRSEAQQNLLAYISNMKQHSLGLAIIETLRLPRFFYASHYDRMSGKISLNKLKQDIANNTVSIGDQIFLNFLHHARISLENLATIKEYEALKVQLERASSDITNEIFEFWSQSSNLQIQLDVNEGRKEDPAPYDSGIVFTVRIYNSEHKCSTTLSERSAGFIWFFSFLSQFKQLQGCSEKIILLLDEPGLTLHGQAQSDLLRYLRDKLESRHQVIYSTHSPFLIPPDNLATVRIVEDVRKREDGKVQVLGTKVSNDIMSMDESTILPLQAHLGYEITRSLFIGKHTLFVESPAEIVYLNLFSAILKRKNRACLDDAWAICPAGGISEFSSFASLFGGNRANVAVLCSYDYTNKAEIEKLNAHSLFESTQIFPVCDFMTAEEDEVMVLIRQKLSG